MSRVERAIAAYLAGDLIGVRDAYAVAGERDGVYALDIDDSDPASERTCNLDLTLSMSISLDG